MNYFTIVNSARISHVIRIFLAELIIARLFTRSKIIESWPHSRVRYNISPSLFSPLHVPRIPSDGAAYDTLLQRIRHGASRFSAERKFADFHRSAVHSHRVASPPRVYPRAGRVYGLSSLSFPPDRPTDSPTHRPSHTYIHVCPFRRASTVHILARIPYACTLPTIVYRHAQAPACDICLGCTWRLSGVVVDGWVARVGGWTIVYSADY